MKSHIVSSTALIAGLLYTASAGAALAQDAPVDCDRWAQSPAAWAEVEAGIRANYAYLDRVDNVDDLLEQAAHSAHGATTLGELGRVAETLGYAFRDGHFHVRPVSGEERAWIPSASDFWLEWTNGRWLVSDVKHNSAAALQGIRPGMELIAMDGQPITELAKAALFPVEQNPTKSQIEYAGNVVASGRLNQERAFAFRSGVDERELVLPPGLQSVGNRAEGFFEVTDHDGIVRIRFNNSLGNNSLIQGFDRAMQEHSDARAIILDFRDTPSGGNTTVARAILGHFVSEPAVYQIHRNMVEETQYGVRRQYAEYVFPRGDRFERPVVILAGRWTGSVGEALAMAFDRTVGADTIGTPLADLLGTLNNSSTDNGCLSLSFAWDKLFANDGTPRENWIPQIALRSADSAADGSDPGVARAIAVLEVRSND